MTLVVNGEFVAGAVRFPTATYAIQAAGPGHVTIREDGPSEMAEILRETPLSRVIPIPRSSDRVRPITSPVRGTRAVPPDGGDEDGSRIDVMVVYTSAARDEAGGTNAIRAAIDLRVAETNHAYLKSGVVQQLHLVWTAEVDYSAGSGNVSPLDRLIDPSDGYMDAVHVMRDRYAADLVHLIIDNSFTRSGSNCTGEAKPVRDPLSEDAAERTPFSSTTTGCDSVVFAHETGHSMGLRHDRYAEIHGCCGRLNMAYPYSHGYVNQRAFEPDAPASSRWHTIMTSNSQQCHDAGFSCERLLRFSNPDMTYNGDPMGVPGDKPTSSVDGPADARRSLNETRRAVANFRVAPCLQGGSVIGLRANNGQFLTAENGGGGAVAANRDEAGDWELFELEDRNGGCVESGDAVALRTSDGFYFRAGLDRLDAMGTSAGTWETFTFYRRSGDGAVRNGDSIALEAASGRYILAVLGGGGAVNAGGTQLVEAWETFKVTVGLLID